MKAREVHITFRQVFRGLPVLSTVLAVGALLCGPHRASAQSTLTGGCIQNVWQAHGNTSNLNCTANDVRIAQVTNICVPDSTHATNNVFACWADHHVAAHEHGDGKRDG